MLDHPALAERSCDDCQRWIYDERGRRRWRVDRWVEWPAGLGPDCFRCPKCEGNDRPGPETGRNATLTMRNLATLHRYFEHKATPGPVDSIARRNFGLLERVFAARDRATQEAIAESLAVLCIRVRR